MKRVIPCVVITLAMIFAGSFLPVFGFLGLVLSPLPLSVLGCVESRKNTSAAELMIEATLFLAYSPSMAAYFLLGCAPLSAMIFMLSQENFREVRKLTGGEGVVLCIGTSVFFKTILLGAFWFFTGRNIFLPNVRSIEPIISELYGSQPELAEALRRVLSVLPHLLPSMLLIYAGIEAFLNYALCRSITRKYFPKSKNFPPELPEFKSWKFPVSLFIVSLAGLVMGWFTDIDTWFTGAVFVMNLQIVINAVMFVQGLSLALWIIDGFKLKRGVKILICLILSVPFFWPWLIVIGMCEMAINVRDRIKFKGSQ
ncbi:MAG: DUF2232 domain-containing protein [Synergistaceae bacterium]|nr:DUF2232 domain-containing protein [Synergistaceae bacterium]